MSDIILELKNIHVTFPIKRSGNFIFPKYDYLNALNNVSLSLHKGEILGIVGESGAGKSTIARAIVKLININSGQIIYNQNDLAKLNKQQMQPYRQDIQMVFQDPVSSLNPALTIFELLAEPLKNFNPELNNDQIKQQVLFWLNKVGLSDDVLNNYPHQFSGGQCQRISIARAMILRPKIIICDEAVASLDVSIQAQIINLLKDMQKEFSLSLIFISHDLSIIYNLCDSVAVLYLGKIMEYAPVQELFKNPLNPYTKYLFDSILSPVPNKNNNKNLLSGEIPSPLNIPTGCVFQSRCPIGQPKCQMVNNDLIKCSDNLDNQGIFMNKHYNSCPYTANMVE